MKSTIFIIILLFASLCSFSQSKKELENQISVLNAQIETLNAQIEGLNTKIELFTEKNKALEKEKNDFKFQLETANKEISRIKATSQQTANPNSQTQTTQPLMTSPQQLNKSESQSSSTKRCKAITNSGEQCKRNADAGSDYCWQHKEIYEPSKSSNNSLYGTGSSNSKEIHTGPRGGKYYINSKGNKVYIKK